MSMRTRAGKKISLTNYEELLAVSTIEGASDIPLDQLHEFKGYPFHVVDDEAMDAMVEMIQTAVYPVQSVAEEGKKLYRRKKLSPILY